MVRKLLQGNRIAVAATICATYLLLTIFYYHIDRYLNWIAVLFTWILVAISFVLIIVRGVLEVVGIFRMGKQITFRYSIPAIVYVLTILYIFCPVSMSSAPSEKDVELRACFEGTQNQASLKFFKDGNFVLHWTGAFAYSEYYSGTYLKVDDTLFLSYKTEKPFRLGRKILNKNGLLKTLDTPREEGQYNATFYLGYCKGLN